MVGNMANKPQNKNKVTFNMLINSLTYLTSVYCLSDTVLDTGNTGVDKTDILLRTLATEFKPHPHSHPV